MALYPELDDREWLERRYLHDWAPLDEIAAEIGCHVSSLQVALRRLGIPPRQAHDIPRAAVEALLARGATLSEIARRYDVHLSIISDRVYTWGLRRSKRPAGEVRRIRDWYERRGWSIRQIADTMGCTPRTVRHILRSDGVEVRPRGRRPTRQG